MYEYIRSIYEIYSLFLSFFSFASFLFFLSFFFFFLSSFFKKIGNITNDIVYQNKKKLKKACVIEKGSFTLSQITCRLLKDFVLSWLRITTKPHQIKLHSFDGGALLF